MRGKTIWTIVLVLSVFLFAACRTNQPTQTSSSTAPAKAASPDTRPCVANITVEGSALTGRTFRTFQDFSDVARAAAFDQIAQSLATSGWTIASSNKETGVITSWAQPRFSKGETESLNVVIRDKGAAGIRVEITYIAPAMAAVSKATLDTSFCKIMEDVQSGKKKSPGQPQPKPTGKPPEAAKESKPVTSGGDSSKVVVIVPSENLRNGPGGKIIGNVKKDTSLVILEDQGKWLRVRLEDGTEAWIWKASTASK